MPECTKCHSELSLSCFRVRNTNKGHSSLCIPCLREYAEKYRQTHREELREKAKQLVVRIGRDEYNRKNRETRKLCRERKKRQRQLISRFSPTTAARGAECRTQGRASRPGKEEEELAVDPIDADAL